MENKGIIVQMPTWQQLLESKWEYYFTASEDDPSVKEFYFWLLQNFELTTKTQERGNS